MGLAIGSIIVGLIVALLGRRLYWMFVAIAGFAVGWSLAPAIFGGLATWAWVLVGVVLGVVFALLSVKFMKFMVAFAGFFAFGSVAVALIRWLDVTAASGSWSWWVAYIVGGLIGAVLLAMFFDWALIVLTTLSGAGAVAAGVNHWSNPRWLMVVIWIVVVAMGLTVQFLSLRGTKRAPKTVKGATLS